MLGEGLVEGLSRRYMRMFMRLHRLRIDLLLRVSVCVMAETLALVSGGLAHRSLRDLIADPASMVLWISESARVTEALEPEGALEENFREHLSSLNQYLREFTQELDFASNSARILRIDFLAPTMFRSLARTALAALYAAVILVLPLAELAKLAGWVTVARIIAYTGLLIPASVWGFLLFNLSILLIRSRMANKLAGQLEERPCAERIQEILNVLGPQVFGRGSRS